MVATGDALKYVRTAYGPIAMSVDPQACEGAHHDAVRARP
jgi:hypothetical protein